MSMLRLNVHEKKLNRLHPFARKLVLYFPMVLAGGAVRDACFNKPISDYDFFLLDRFDDTLMSVLKRDLDLNGFKEVFSCPLGQLTTYKKVYPNVDAVPAREVKFQFIRKGNYGGAEELMHTFDFNACRFAYDNLNLSCKVLTYREAIRDVITQRLSIHNIYYPASSINRLYKYRNKGYYVGDAIKDIVNILMDPDYVSSGNELYID